MSNGYDWHIGDRSWWDGAVKTACGLRIRSKDATSDLWFLGGPSNPCPVCKAAQKRNSK